MADNKKGFVLYADQNALFKMLTDEQAGRLIKHIFEYVNDKKPETEDLIINVAFEPIKTQLKRDLQKYEQIKAVKQKAGRKSAELRAKARELNEKQDSAKDPAEVETGKDISTHVESVPTQSNKSNCKSKSKSNSKSKSKSDISIIDKKGKFTNLLQPHLSKYGKDMLNDFFEYWTEHSQGSNKLRHEKEKTFNVATRLSRWNKNNFKTGNSKGAVSKPLIKNPTNPYKDSLGGIKSA